MIQGKSFKKWLLISALCGGHSFFWGMMTNGNPVAMVLGILTLALMFAYIESCPNYQSKRTAAPRLARALDGGVKFRCWLAVYIPLSTFFMGYLGKLTSWVSAVLGAPYMGEMFIGMGAMSLTRMLTGVNLEAQRPEVALSAIDNFIATYLTTIFTGLAHTIILGLICLIAYGVVRLRDKKKASVANESAPQ